MNLSLSYHVCIHHRGALRRTNISPSLRLPYENSMVRIYNCTFRVQLDSYGLPHDKENDLINVQLQLTACPKLTRFMSI
jgi:hypothetical protein